MGLNRKFETLALDIEGTLISNAVSQFVRPGLYGFLEFCRSSFPRVVIYTRVEEHRFRKLAKQLVLEGSVPEWFGALPHVHWSSEHKDLRLIEGSSVKTCLIVDDLEEAIHPDQLVNWVQIEPYQPPYADNDRELERVAVRLSEFLREGINYE